MADDNAYQSYSPAVLYKDIVWTENNLFQFLHAPRKFIPGTKMIFPGIKSKKDRKGDFLLAMWSHRYNACRLFQADTLEWEAEAGMEWSLSKPLRLSFSPYL